MSLKSPLGGYYGGKSRVAKWILSHISAAACRKGIGYIEPFAGGASVFFNMPSLFAKNLYVLNDTNGAVINFYLQAKRNRKELVQYAAERALHSRQIYADAAALYHAGKKDLPTAWAVWYLVRMSFGGILPKNETGVFGLKKTCSEFDSQSTMIRRAAANLDESLARLECATIESKPALDVIAYFNHPDNFLYVDPPYIQTNQGHYAGYTEGDYAELLLALADTKCHFALSGYDDELTRKSAEEFGWRRAEKETITCAGKKTPRKEILTMNFPPAQDGIL